MYICIRILCIHDIYNTYIHLNKCTHLLTCTNFFLHISLGTAIFSLIVITRFAERAF